MLGGHFMLSASPLSSHEIEQRGPTQNVSTLYTNHQSPCKQAIVKGLVMSSMQNKMIIFLPEFAEYYLMEPSAEYAPYMKVVREKTQISNYIISMLVDDHSTTYEELLERLQVK